MLKHVSDREEELVLLQWCLDTAPVYKELIQELEAHVDNFKKNGEVHKGNQKIRLSMIRDLKKELKIMKDFFIKRRDEPDHWSSARYSLKGQVSEHRQHLHKREDIRVDEGLLNPS